VEASPESFWRYMFWLLPDVKVRMLFHIAEDDVLPGE